MPIGIIGVSKKIENKLKKKKKKVFFGGTYSGNPLTAFVGNETLKFILKNKKKIFTKIEKNSKFLHDKLNDFIIQNDIDAKVIRFHSLIRILFSKAIVQNRTQRDFFEKRNLNKRKKFIKFLENSGIYFPGNGIISLSYSLNEKQIEYTSKVISKGLKKFFQK